MSAPERVALDEAFVAGFANLFQVLVSGYVSGDEQMALERFERGLKHHRDAYEAVLQIVTNQSSHSSTVAK